METNRVLFGNKGGERDTRICVLSYVSCYYTHRFINTHERTKHKYDILMFRKFQIICVKKLHVYRSVGRISFEKIIFDVEVMFLIGPVFFSLCVSNLCSLTKESSL